jgi:hypothetical protein
MSAYFFALPVALGETWVDFTVALSGVNYAVELRWCDRQQLWLLSMSSVVGALDVVRGAALAVGPDLMCRPRAVAPDLAPTGILRLYALGGVTTDPGLDDLANYALCYFEAGELPPPDLDGIEGRVFVRLL